MSTPYWPSGGRTPMGIGERASDPSLSRLGLEEKEAHGGRFARSMPPCFLSSHLIGQQKRQRIPIARPFPLRRDGRGDRRPAKRFFLWFSPKLNMEAQRPKPRTLFSCCNFAPL